MMGKKRLLKCVMAVAMVFSLSMTTYASSIEDAKEDKSEAEEKRDEAQEILDSLESKRDDLAAYVEELDGQLATLQNQIADLNSQIDTLNVQITEKQAELEVAKTEEQQQYNDMKKRIQFLYENGDMDYLEVIMTAGSMSEMLNRSEYISQISEYDYNMLTSLIAIREQIANDEAKLNADLASVESLKAEAEEKSATVETLISTKTAEIGNYEKSIAEQEEIVRQYEADVKAQDDLIARLEREALLREQAASGTTNVVYSGGALLWPCPASTRITSYFGSREQPVPGASTNHKGIDIGVPTGSQVIAAASGTVIVSTYSSSAGYYITISHGGGLSTVYMHNSQLLVNVGDTVTAGQVIALSGSTGYSSGPHLHFGVRVNGEYVNPLSYY